MLRRSFSRAAGTSPLHLAGAFAPDSGLVPGQVAVDGKSNEIKALPALLELLNLEGAPAAADAMHTQRTASELTAGKGGDCVLALKANQASLRKGVAAWLDAPGEAENVSAYQKVDGGHGRGGKRTATVSRNVELLQDIHRWPDLGAVGKIEAVRESEGRNATETRQCIMSREMSPEASGTAVRSHWAIENSLHWVLDVQMREDDLRNRKDAGPGNLAALRRLALNIVRQAGDELSIRRSFRWAALSMVCLFKLIRKAASPAVEF